MKSTAHFPPASQTSSGATMASVSTGCEDAMADRIVTTEAMSTIAIPIPVLITKRSVIVGSASPNQNGVISGRIVPIIPMKKIAI